MKMWKTLQKFGTKHCDLPTMVWNISCMLRPLTINIDSRNKQPIPIIFYFLFMMHAAVYIYTYLFSMVWFVFWQLLPNGDLISAMIIFSLGITSAIGVIKFIFIYMYRNTVKTLLQDYLICDSKVIPGTRSHFNLSKALRNVKKRAILYWLFININGGLYIMKPLFMPVRTSMEDIFTLYGLDPPLETPNYELGYYSMAAGSFFTCYLTSNVAAFLIIMSGYVEAQLLVLSEELLHVYNDSENQYNQQQHIMGNSPVHIDVSEEYDALMTGEEFSTINEIVGEHLRDIVKTHVMNIELLNKFKTVFKGAFALEFIVLSVGLIAELLGGLENTYMQVPFAIIQVAVDCLVGQRLMDACDAFLTAVYSCQWEKFSPHNMKTVYVMLINAQKTLTLSIGDVAILNFTCLMSVLRSVYSAFTTLQSVL